MATPNKKSGSFRKIFVRVITGTKTTYKRRKNNIAKCSCCGKGLIGISKAFNFKIRNTPKTKKKASRPYSNLCSACMRQKIIKGARKNA